MGKEVDVKSSSLGERSRTSIDGTLDEGTVVDGRYVIGAPLGRGGMGAVYRAYHTARRAPVALKVLSREAMAAEAGVARFAREAMLASMVESDHVVRVLDAGSLPHGAPYIVMELLRGRDLSTLLREDGCPGLPIPRAVHLMMQVLHALQAAHRARVIHRDLKLSNCFVVRHGGDEDFVKVLDFGGSKLRTPGATVLTATNSFLGTPSYMAPEQAMSAKAADERSDLYSVGVMLYKLLSGSLPISFEGKRTIASKIVCIVTAEATPLSDVLPGAPPDLCDVVHRAIRRDPAARFGSALEFAEALVPFASPASLGIVEAMRRALPSRVPPPTERVSDTVGRRDAETQTASREAVRGEAGPESASLDGAADEADPASELSVTRVRATAEPRAGDGDSIVCEVEQEDPTVLPPPPHAAADVAPATEPARDPESVALAAPTRPSSLWGVTLVLFVAAAAVVHVAVGLVLAP
jgi:serine/threonine-protein kinase